MAGGSGTRFWPLSRAAHPKQFLTLDGAEESLLQATVRRATRLMPLENVLVVTSATHAEETRRQLPALPAANILAEPAGRNTTPCIGWAAVHVQRRDAEGVMMVLPADPHIEDEDGFVATLDRALDVATPGGIVTVGITPTRPETGYGYIEPGPEVGPDAPESGDRKTAGGPSGVREVARFVEKPDATLAQTFVDAGMLWNSGMFFFRASVILDAIAEFQPELSSFLVSCATAIEEGREAALVTERYPSLPAVSIDYGVMEKAEGIRVLPGDFGWHDVGSWTSAWELAERDEDDNAVSGQTELVDSKGCYVRGSDDKLIAVVGIDDLVVVDSEDALLVVPRNRAQDVGAMVKSLRQRKLTRFL